MSPAEGERDRRVRPGVGDGLVDDIAVALHDAAITVEQLEGVDGAATGRVSVGHRRRVGPAPRPIVARDRPEEALLGAAAAGVEHRRCCLVDRDLARGQNDLRSLSQSGRSSTAAWPPQNARTERLMSIPCASST